MDPIPTCRPQCRAQYYSPGRHRLRPYRRTRHMPCRNLIAVMAWGPKPTWVPAHGLWVIVTVPEQLSAAETLWVTSGIAAIQLPSADAVNGAAGHMTEGGVVSTTVTMAEHELDAPWLSVTVSVTVVLPSG